MITEKYTRVSFAPPLALALMLIFVWGALGMLLATHVAFGQSAQSAEDAQSAQDAQSIINDAESAPIEEVDGAEGEATEVEMVTVANVETYDALLVRQLEREVEVSFILANESDLVQPGVSYSLHLFALGEGEEANGYLVDERHYATDLTLAPQSERTIRETYRVPDEVPEGQYFLTLKVSNEAGLTFAEDDIAEVAVSGAPKQLDLVFDLNTCFLEVGEEGFGLFQGVDVAAEEDVSLVCDVRNVTESEQVVVPTARVFDRTYFGEEVDVRAHDEVVFAPGATGELRVPVARQDAPGAYQTRLELVDSTEEVVAALTYRHVEQGLSAVILNARFDKEAYAAGETASIEVFLNGRADQFPGSRIGFIDQDDVDYRYDLILTDGSSNEECGVINNQPFPRSEVLSRHQMQLDRDCENLKLTILAKEGSDGGILSQKDFRTEGRLPAEPTFAERFAPIVYLVTYVVVLLTALYGAFYMWQRHRGRNALIIKTKEDLDNSGSDNNGDGSVEESKEEGQIDMKQNKNNNSKGGGTKMLMLLFLTSALYFGGGAVAEAKTSCYSTYGGLSTSCVTTSVKYKTVSSCGEQVVKGSADFNPCSNRDAEAKASVNGKQIFSNSCKRTSFEGCCHPTMECDGKGSRAIAPGSAGSRSACVDYTLRSWNTSNRKLDDNIKARVCQSYSVVSCSVNGVCGVANDGVYASEPPTASACSKGSLSNMRLEGGVWSWSCLGQSGGSAASCSASHAISGLCGSAANEPFTSTTPSSNLCSVGEATVVSLSNESENMAWVWSCLGTGGGSDASCRIEDGPGGNTEPPGNDDDDANDDDDGNDDDDANDDDDDDLPPDPGDPQIIADPNLIDSGDTTLVRWNPGGYADCTITSTHNDSRIDSDTVTTAEENTDWGEDTSSEIFGEVTYTIMCADGTEEDKATVRVREQVEEF